MRPVKTRILDDRFAKHFVRDWRYVALFSYRPIALPVAQLYNKLFPGWAAEIILRYRHCDEQLRREVERGCKQVVILGAGYDSTALRCQFNEAVTIYELDKPAIQRHKIDIISRKSLCTKHPVEYVSCDFDAGDDLTEQLLSRGFAADQQCFVSWLGVSYYLSEAAVRDTLDKLARVCAPGSKVMLDYIVPSVVDQTIDHAGALRGARFAAKRGEQFSFGLERDCVHDLLSDNSFRLSENHAVSDLIELYGDPENFWLSVADFIGVLTLERDTITPAAREQPTNITKC